MSKIVINYSTSRIQTRHSHPKPREYLHMVSTCSVLRRGSPCLPFPLPPRRQPKYLANGPLPPEIWGRGRSGRRCRRGQRRGSRGQHAREEEHRRGRSSLGEVDYVCRSACSVMNPVRNAPFHDLGKVELKMKRLIKLTDIPRPANSISS